MYLLLAIAHNIVIPGYKDITLHLVCLSAFRYIIYGALAPSFLIGSSSFLQVTKTTIKARTSSKFDQIRPWTAELAALEHLEKSP